MCARLASAADAFLLKIAIEERLGYPVMLIGDGLVGSIESALNLTGPASLYAALAAGTADIYPEVCRGACIVHVVDGARAYRACGVGGGRGGQGVKHASQVWLSEEMEEYDLHVRQAGDVCKLQVPVSYGLCTASLVSLRRWSRSACSASPEETGGSAARRMWSVGTPSLDTVA